MKKIIVSVLVFTMLICSLSSFAKYEIEYGGITQNQQLKSIIKEAARADSSLLYPPNEHPYVFVNPEFIAHLKENKDSDEYKLAYKNILTAAKKDMPTQPEGGIISDAISTQMTNRAFMYLMGEFDKAHAQETVKYTIEYVKNAKSNVTNSIARYKDFGNNAIQVGALVYDWCYDAMTPAQRNELATAVRDHMYSSEQPCRPDNTAGADWGDINGKAVGQPIIYNSIGATAIYDLYPEVYEAIMGKVQGTMAQISKLYGEAGALTDGSTAYSREYYTYYVELLLMRMGHDISDIYGIQLPVGFKVLYGRLPYGTHLKTGDSGTHLRYKIGTYDNSVDVNSTMGFLQVMFEEPYLKHYYMRENSTAGGVLNMILKTSTHEAETPDDLPLAFEAFDPRSEIIHKTSWQEGMDSPQVTAYLNMNNRRSGDHDHANFGSFQLHYKGPLSIEQGVYYGGDWGDVHWRNYASRSVASNTMLVYNPDEVYVYGSNVAEANDGGQMMVSNKSGGYVRSEIKEHLAENNHRATTEGTYIGPNEMTPAFSYIKGDITEAYSPNKMASYKRGMVFMDTFNETYPGVLVVFDRVVSTKASYPKTWLLQAVSEPEISGNKITIKNTTEKDCNGKLVNTVLYPENIKTEVVGGINKFISEGEEWMYTSASEGLCSDAYKSGWRAEVKPQTNQAEDIFLNAMFVADADTTAPDLEMIKVEDNLFMGVATLDRQVMFSKNGELIDKQFTVEVKDNNAGGNMLTLLTDIQPGKWSISGNGTEKIVEVKEYDNAFVFEGKAGTYKVTPVSEDAEVTEVIWPEAEKEKIGDFSIKVGTVYQYMREPNKIVDGIPYIGQSFINHSTLCSAVKEGNNLVITAPDESVITLTAGQKEYTITKSGKTPVTKKAENAPFIDEQGVFYFNHAGGVGAAIGLSVNYIASAASMAITLKPFVTSGSSSGVTQGSGSLPGVDESKVIWPVSVFVSSDDGNIASNLTDRDLSTRWSSIQGDEE